MDVHNMEYGKNVGLVSLSWIQIVSSCQQSLLYYSFENIFEIKISDLLHV